MDQGKSAAPDGQGDEAAVPAAAATTSNPANTATEPPAAQSQPDVRADDDESDWEELDEVLDDFSKPKTSDQAPSKQQPDQQEEGQTLKSSDEQETGIDEAEMIKQLEAGMAELMKGGSGPPAEGSGGGDEDWNALAEELSKNGMQPAELMKLMLGEDIASGVGGEGGTTGGDNKDTTNAGKTAEAAPSGENFQDTIQKTMERIQNSGEKATAAANEGEGDDLLMQMLKAMEASGLGEAGEGGDENLDKIFTGIMEQLSNKEMLYEPMKELHEKFGPWLKENKDKVSQEDLERYELQSTIVAEIVAKFDEEGYTDENPEHRAYVWERMQKMQSAGSPPDDLVSNPLGDESKLQEALGGDGAGCPQQ